MSKQLTWTEVKKELNSISQEDIDEIDLKVKIIGEILKERQNANLTQAQMGELTGMKQEFIARIESNKTDPQLTTVLKLLRPLGLTLEIVPLVHK